MFLNAVIGTPLVDPTTLLSYDKEDWEKVEEDQTLFTNQRFLQALLKEAGIAPSTNEVRRNRPDLVVTLDKPDCFWVKWGKKKLYIIVGE